MNNSRRLLKVLLICFMTFAIVVVSLQNKSQISADELESASEITEDSFLQETESEQIIETIQEETDEESTEDYLLEQTEAEEQASGENDLGVKEDSQTELGSSEEMENDEESDIVLKDDSEMIYVVNNNWQAVKQKDIITSCERTGESITKNSDLIFESNNIQELYKYIASRIEDNTAKFSIKYLMSAEEYKRKMDVNSIAEELVNETIRVDRESGRPHGLCNQYYGYSYVQKNSLELKLIAIEVDYTFVSWKNLILNGKSLYETVMTSTYSNPLAQAAHNEFVIRENEGHYQDTSVYNIECWGTDNGYGWCGAFVGYCGKQIGYNGTKGFMPPKPDYGTPSVYSSWYVGKDASVATVITGSNINYNNIQSGDILICDNSNAGLYNHVAIVLYSGDTGILAVEGNMTVSGYSHPIVWEKTHQLSDSDDIIVKVVRPNPGHLTNYIRVNFNYANGSGGPGYKFVAKYGTYGTLPSPTRTGYTFAGWYTSSSGGTLVNSASSLSQNSNHTLYAHWTPKRVTVKYYGYGDGSFSESQYLGQDVFYYGTSNQYLRNTSYASTGYIATG